jgi:hypothetical protein
VVVAEGDIQHRHQWHAVSACDFLSDLVAVFLGLELRHQPFARVHPQPRALHNLGIDGVAAVLSLCPVIPAIVGNLEDFLAR